MKKLLVLALVLSMAPMANAGLVITSSNSNAVPLNYPLWDAFTGYPD